jgi:hypothetical protein
VPQVRSIDDTKYFDEDESVSDWPSTDSSEDEGPPPHDVAREALRGFRSKVQAMATQLVASPYDTFRLRQIGQRIDEDPNLCPDEREVLKLFVRCYGKRERKRPRDRLLRDSATKTTVMRLRKRTAFLGYTWRRRRVYGYGHGSRYGSISGAWCNAPTSTSRQPSLIMTYRGVQSERRHL